jgi:cation transport ATPase
VAHRHQIPLAAVELAVSLTFLAGGGVAYLVGEQAVAHAAWATATAIGLAAAAWWTWASVRRHRLGADIIAVLALLGTLAIGEYFAGAVIAVMLGSGRALEARASARARTELRTLRERAPRFVHRIEGDALVSRSVEEVRPGDLLVTQPGEIVPVDGRLADGPATLDESALTGEPLPVERGPDDDIRSGVVNAGSAFTMRATTGAENSTYEIAHLIRRLGRVLDTIDPERPDDVEGAELRRLLYGLHAILRLHFAQEEEEYFTLLDEQAS